MVIECSSCHARFKLADDKIKESGTKVRCTKCREVFTVFPENPPPIAPPIVAVTPANPAVPVVVPQKVAEDALFAGTATSAFPAEISSPAVDVPVSEEDDWDQQAEANFFPDGFAGDAGASDLDAISFDNTEVPVFSVSNEKESKFEFTDETAFSFSDLSFEGGSEQSHNIAVATDEKFLSVESDNGFEADYSAPATIPQFEDLGKFNTVTTEGEFTFSGADNLADFSWDEPDAAPIATTPPTQIEETGAESQGKNFDFSSFSFDDVSSAVVSGKNDETVAQGEATIELSLNTDAETAPVEARLLPAEMPLSPVVAREHQENTPRTARSLRPRVRQKKKGSSRLAVKVIILIFLALTATYAFINRDQIQRVYKNIVNSFIENQTRVETSGRIGLTKLSGSYVVNSREGDLFVIRGEAVNEFKGLRSSVLVRGTIYGDNGTILQSQSAYCGNPVKDSSLKELSYTELRNRMSNELGENLVNLNIAAGKGIPFTIVFNNVPKNIKEFTVEVLESKPGSK